MAKGKENKTPVSIDDQHLGASQATLLILKQINPAQSDVIPANEYNDVVNIVKTWELTLLRKKRNNGKEIKEKQMG